MQKERLFSYKMTHDTGFAPNPFHGILTLATCKPGMRRTKQIGDWVAGFSSNALSKNANRLGISIDTSALIYLGKVENVVPIAEYYLDKRYRRKIPSNAELSDEISRMGDNIYEPSPLELYEFKQVSNLNHYEGDIWHDVSGENVLVFGEYYYLGQKGKPPPEHIEISKPKGPLVMVTKRLMKMEKYQL